MNEYSMKAASCVASMIVALFVFAAPAAGQSGASAPTGINYRKLSPEDLKRLDAAEDLVKLAKAKVKSGEQETGRFRVAELIAQSRGELQKLASIHLQLRAAEENRKRAAAELSICERNQRELAGQLLKPVPALPIRDKTPREEVVHEQRSPVRLGSELEVHSLAEALRIGKGIARLNVETTFSRKPPISMDTQEGIDEALAEAGRINRIELLAGLLKKENAKLESMIQKGASDADLAEQNAKIAKIVESLKLEGATVQFRILPVEH